MGKTSFFIKIFLLFDSAKQLLLMQAEIFLNEFLSKINAWQFIQKSCFNNIFHFFSKRMFYIIITCTVKLSLNFV
jgi:hypothetical protein